MKVAYVLNSPNAANYKVGEMILPQLENDAHGVEVVGIFFFDDNTMLLQKGNPNCSWRALFHFWGRKVDILGPTRFQKNAPDSFRKNAHVRKPYKRNGI